MASQALAPEAPLPVPIGADHLDRITRQLAETAESYDRSAEFPRANFDPLGREGLISLTVPIEHGARRIPVRSVTRAGRRGPGGTLDSADPVHDL